MPTRNPCPPSLREQKRRAFTCIHCGHTVPLDAPGTRHRNHCPRCLWSRHVDNKPGDRACRCHGPMAPIAVEVRPNGEWALIHRCQSCGHLRTNRIAGDDDELALLRLALRSLSSPPFPMEGP